MHAQGDHVSFRRNLAGDVDGPHDGTPGHLEIEQGHVRLPLADSVERIISSACLCNNFNAGSSIDQRDKTLSEQPMVISNNQANHAIVCNW